MAPHLSRLERNVGRSHRGVIAPPSVPRVCACTSSLRAIEANSIQMEEIMSELARRPAKRTAGGTGVKLALAQATATTRRYRGRT